MDLKLCGVYVTKLWVCDQCRHLFSFIGVLEECNRDPCKGYMPEILFYLQIRVVIHPPGTIPYPFTEGYDVPPGFSASIGIKPVKNIRVGLPHGNCSVTDPFGGGENCANGGSVYRLMSCQKMCLQVGIKC